jgi:hypothetical protein
MNRGTLAVGAVLLAAAASATGYASPAGSIGGGFMGSDGAPLAALADSFLAGSSPVGERLQPDPFARRDDAVDVRGGLRGHAADEAAARGSGSAVASPSGDVPSGSGGDLEAELLKALEASTVFNPAAAPSPPEDFRILSSGPVDSVNDLVVAPAAANDAAPSDPGDDMLVQDAVPALAALGLVAAALLLREFVRRRRRAALARRVKRNFGRRRARFAPDRRFR